MSVVIYHDMFVGIIAVSL